MSHQFNEELISAYLDGELTADEQALVEQQLNESAEHQQVLAELSALRESFQALPTHQLDERFGERVLRAAERSMLVQSQVSNSGPTESKAGKELPTPASLPTDDRRGWRMAVGSVAAVAALVLVTLFLANRGDEATDDLAVTQHEEKNAGDKPDKNGDNSSADSSSALSEAQPEKQLQAGAAVQNSAGEPLDRPFSASPSRSGQTTAPAGSEGGFGGGTGNRPTALGGHNGVARDVNKSPAAEHADGAEQFYDEGLRTNSLDGVVIIELAREQSQLRPVEVALTRLQVRELQPASSLALWQTLADQTATIEPRSNNGLEELKAQEFQDEGGKALDSRDEILVVATASEIAKVCEMLREQGLNARFDGNEVAAAAVAPLLRGRKLPTKIAQQVEGPNQDAKLSEAKKRNQDNERNLRPPAPSTEKADADKFGGAAVSPKPVPPARARHPKATKDEEKAQEKLPSLTDSPARPGVRRSVTPASKPKEEGEDDAKLEVDKPVGSSGEIAGQDRPRMKNSELSRELVESYRKEVSGSFFYRRPSGPEQLAERKEAAKQLDEADADAATPQRLAKGTVSRGVRTAPAGARADSVSDVAKQTASPLPRLQVRFVIRTIDSSASGSAADEPASKK